MSDLGWTATLPRCLGTTKEGRRCANQGYRPDGMCHRHKAPALRHADSLRARAYELRIAARKLERLAVELEKAER